MESNQVKHAGWDSDLGTFISASPHTIQMSLESFVGEVSVQQANAWREAIPMIQREGKELIHTRALAHQYGTVLEYRLPYELRRPDVIILTEGSVVVLELKGKTSPNQADLD